MPSIIVTLPKETVMPKQESKIVYDDSELEDNLSALSGDPTFISPTGRLNRAKKAGLTRSEVIATFAQAFEQIGGTNRLAVWADSYPNEFYKLYGRLLPASSSAELDGDQEIVVRHALPPPKTPQAPQAALGVQVVVELDD